MNDLALRPGTLNGIALCAGIGGLELGLKLALGDAYHCRLFIEREAFAAAVLVARMEDATLDRAPIWDAVESFDGKPWRGLVDIVSAGFPCQPFSLAGQRKGLADERWIWPAIAQIIREVGPTYVYLENVPDLARHGLATVLGDLSEMGFDTEWDLFSAEEAGAPHRRERLFLLAHTRRRGHHAQQPQSTSECGGAARVSSACAELAYANGKCQQGERVDAQGKPDPEGSGERLADAGNGFISDSWRGSQRRDGARPASQVNELGNAAVDGRALDGESTRAIRTDPDGSGGAVGQLGDAQGVARGEPDDQSRSEPSQLDPRTASVGASARPRWPPRPGEREQWNELIEIDPRFSPVIRRGADGTAFRVDRLRTLGNGVVPMVAAMAFLTLLNRLHGGG